MFKTLKISKLDKNKIHKLNLLKSVVEIPHFFCVLDISMINVLMKYWGWITLILLFIGILFLPRILTSSHWNEWESFDFSDTGEIGDTIGGITAPFIGIVSAVLVYLSFLKQSEANKLIADQFNIERSINIENEQFSLLLQKIKEWKGEVNNISITKVNSTKTIGKYAILEIFNEIIEINTTQKLEARSVPNLLSLEMVSNYLNDIIVYLTAILPNINSKEKLKLILLELESINRDIIQISPNAAFILCEDHINKPFVTKLKHKLYKIYTIRNYQMLKIEKQLFDLFNPDYDYDLDTDRKTKNFAIERVEYHLKNDTEYRNEIRTINISTN